MQLFLVLTAFIIFFSGSTTRKYLVCSSYEHSMDKEYKYSYDAKNRIIAINGFSDYPINFEYNNDSIIQTQGQTKTYHILDSLNHVILSKTDGDYPLSVEYKYDSIGNMIYSKFTTTYPTFIRLEERYYTYTNGNISNYKAITSSSTDDFENKHVNEKKNQTYYPDTKNNLPINPQQPFLGMGSKNLIKSVTTNGKKSEFLYEFDDEGRVIKKIFSYKDETYDVSSYTYCE